MMKHKLYALADKLEDNKILFGIILLLAIFFSFWGAWVSEFYRHTEADRVLIAWEMLEGNRWLVPTLLGETILTKPPLYYWFLALVFDVFGSYSEFVSRSVSCFFGTLMCLFYAYFYKKQGARGISVLVSSIVFLTGFSFLRQVITAEMDMTFSFFCFAALAFAFWAIEEKKELYYTLGWLSTALGFLVKGPQIIFLYAFGLLFYFLFKLRQERRWLGKDVVVDFIKINLKGFFIFTVLLFLWIVPLVNAVGVGALFAQVQEEIILRAVGEARLDKGRFFYFFASFASLGIIGGVGLVMFILAHIFSIRKHLGYLTYVGELRQWFCDETLVQFSKSDKLKRLIYIYSPVVTIVFVGVMSFTTNKSSRYIFPVYGLLSYMGAAGLMEFAPRIRDYIKQSAFFIREEKPLLKLSCFVVFFSILFRVSYTDVYQRARSNKYSVTSMANEISQDLGKVKEVYSINFFERWLSYYLKLGGVNTQALNFKESPLSGEEIYAIINIDLEPLRYSSLVSSGKARLLKTYDMKKRGRIALLKGPKAVFLVAMAMNWKQGWMDVLDNDKSYYLLR